MLPVKSDRVYKRQLKQAGVVWGDKNRPECERTVNGRRVAHMTPLNIEALAGYGLHVGVGE